MRVAALFVTFLMLAGAPVARAETIKPAAADQEKQSLEEFAASHPTCREWTDGCMVCVRNGDKAFACSLPGIACEPKKLSCGHAMMAPSEAPAPSSSEPPKK